MKVSNLRDYTRKRSEAPMNIWAKRVSSYNPLEIEKKWLKKWNEKPLYQALDFSKKKKFYGLVEFPYPSGEGLHMGHAFTYPILDVLARKKRMDGFDVLHPMGWDAFGLPTENYALKTGIHPAVVTERNTNRFRQQMKRLALAYDWNREVSTTNPAYYKWTQWIFIQLFKHGLAYKQKMPINWCPACKIGLANEEVVAGKCERCGAPVGRKELDQWLLRITLYADRLSDELDLVDYPDYIKAAQRNWIGRKEWIDITYPIEGTNQTISVSTTRPDTNFGATFIVAAPEHPVVASLLNSKLKTQNSKLKEIKEYTQKAIKKTEFERIAEGREKTGVFTGLYCINQLNDRRMPIYVTDFVMTTVGTGAVVGVPAHDLRDFEFAQKFDLPVIRVVVGSDGDTSEITKQEQVQEKEGTMINSEFLNGMGIHQAAKTMMDYLEKKRWGRRAIRYHLRDWIFSRQHYWGEPIPMIYCQICAKKGITWWDTKEGKKFKPLNTKYKILNTNLNGWFPLSEDELPLELPKVKRYQPTGTGESPLASVKDWVKTRCPVCGDEARRETDTMPNWAGSSWYYLAYVFGHKLGKPPRDTSEVKSADTSEVEELAAKLNIFKKYCDLLNYWLPVDIYLGGAEHTTLHLLYSRFWHKFLNDIDVVPGKEPYQARRQHGVILGEDGFRMSKSRGNVINPEQMMEKYGVDSLRLYLMFMGPYDQTMPWNTKGIEGCRRFLNRAWRIYHQKDKIRHSGSGRLDSPEVKGLRRQLHQLIKKVSDDIDRLSHNTAIAAMMEFVNSWSQLSMSLSLEDAGIFLRLLAPFAPYITEELWQQLNYTSEVAERTPRRWSIHQQPWPKYDPSLAKEEMVTVVVQINGKLREKLKVQSAKCKVQSEVEKLANQSGKVQKHLKDKKIKKVIFVPGRLVNFVLD